MKFVFSYDDIRLWTSNFMGLKIDVTSFSKDGGQLLIETPANGILQLLPSGFLRMTPYFYIEDIHATDFTLNIFGPNGSDEFLNDRFSKYLNHQAASNSFTEVIKHGKILVHLDQLRLMRDIELQSLEFTEEGLTIHFKENERLFEQMRMIQMLLRAGYKNVYIVSEYLPYKGYWFSDEYLDYTLRTLNDPSDILIWTSFNIPSWMGLEDVITEDYFQPSYPGEAIHLEYGNLTVSMPFIIAEAEINAKTIERNTSRLKSEISIALTELITYEPKER